MFDLSKAKSENASRSSGDYEQNTPRREGRWAGYIDRFEFEGSQAEVERARRANDPNVVKLTAKIMVKFSELDGRRAGAEWFRFVLDRSDVHDREADTGAAMNVRIGQQQLTEIIESVGVGVEHWTPENIQRRMFELTTRNRQYEGKVYCDYRRSYPAAPTTVAHPDITTFTTTGAASARPAASGGVPNTAPPAVDNFSDDDVPF